MRLLRPAEAAALLLEVKHLSKQALLRRPFIFLFLAGGASTLAMAPIHFWPIMAITLPILFWSLEDGSSAGQARLSWRSAIWRGWAFGFGYHAAGLYWIGNSFFVQAERFAVIMPFAIGLLTAALGLFLAFAAFSYWALQHRLPGPVSRVLAFALVIAVSEWLRGTVFTGFPWNTIGYALTMPLPLMQWAGLFGIYVLSALTVIILTAPLVVLTSVTERRGVILSVLTIGPLVLASAYGYYRLNAFPTAFEPAVQLRLVQPSFTQKEKFQVEMRGAIFNRHLAMSDGSELPAGVRVIRVERTGSASPGAKAALPTHIIWPEASVPFFLRREPAALKAIGDALPDNVHIIAGSYRASVPPELKHPAAGSYRVFNTAMVVRGDGKISSFYDKIKLVPFGEYLPAQKLLNAFGFEDLTRSQGGLAVGARPRKLLSVPGLPPVALLICYEASFPHDVVQGTDRPGLLINLTNDAWFGETSGPYQHLHQTRLRAVEQGLPMLRSANNGVSAVIDPLGRIIAQLPLNAVGVIDAPLPRKISTTTYGRWGVWIELIFAIVLAAAIWIAARLEIRPGLTK